MTTSICTHPCTIVNDQSAAPRWPAFSVWQGLAKLGAWASIRVHTHPGQWRTTASLDHMTAQQLRDVGAPDWLQQRAVSRQAWEDYETIKATSRLKY